MGHQEIPIEESETGMIIRIGLAADLRRIGIALSLSLAVSIAAAHAEMVCLPSVPSAQMGSSVTLSAWYRSPDNPKAELKWTVTSGTLDFRNGVTTWDLKGVEPGSVFADVDAVVNGAKAATCEIQLVVEGKVQAHRSPGAVVMTSRGFLGPSQPEPDGFGLYSYILFGSRPASADRDRYIAILDAALRLLKPTNDLVGKIKPIQLNSTWLPVTSLPASDPDSKWLVDNYDYTSAAVFLARAGIRNPDAIYILSVRSPLSKGAPTPPFLKQDLSHVPAELASTWVTLFINQAAQERFWDSNTFAGVVAKMRLAIALTAQGVPNIETAMATWLSISK
jgi:hypothetical protein